MKVSPMASSIVCRTAAVLFLLFFSSVSNITAASRQTLAYASAKPFVSFPLLTRRFTNLTSPVSQIYSASLASAPGNSTPKSPTLKAQSTFRFQFKYTMALVLSLPVGTPPQSQPMVLDTGSQLSWVQCEKRKNAPAEIPSFDPSHSSSFSVLSCKIPPCKPSVPDFSVPTSCDANLLCHYSYFYADGTLAEGNLVHEKISLSSSRTTEPVILGCSRDASAREGILGMNLGRLSFVSQAKIGKFSYCVPRRRHKMSSTPMGEFLVGENPLSGGFKYVNLLRFSSSQQTLPNLDKYAYSVPMSSIRIAGKVLDIPKTAFLPDEMGAGQTMVDSGTEFTFLVEEAYAKVKAEVERRVGSGRLKKGYVYAGALDTCFVGRPAEIGRLIGEIVFEMGAPGVAIRVGGRRALFSAGGGVSCLSIGSSQLLGVESNIIGNFHQQDMWVEFDVQNRKLGLAEANCTASLP